MNKIKKIRLDVKHIDNVIFKDIYMFINKRAALNLKNKLQLVSILETKFDKLSDLQQYNVLTYCYNNRIPIIEN